MGSELFWPAKTHPATPQWATVRKKSKVQNLSQTCLGRAVSGHMLEWCVQSSPTMTVRACLLIWDLSQHCCVESVSFWTWSDFWDKKIKLNGSSQNWYQMKGMGKTREKSLINMGSRVDHLAVGPISMSQVRPETLLCRVSELLNIDKFSTEILYSLRSGWKLARTSV